MQQDDCRYSCEVHIQAQLQMARTLATSRILFMAEMREQPLTSSSVSTGSRSSVDTASCASPVAPRRLSRNSCSSSRGWLPAARDHGSNEDCGSAAELGLCHSDASSHALAEVCPTAFSM
jgi:hypothetical protein